MRKIINITIFALAGLATLLALIFAIGFNQDTTDKFKGTNEIKANNPQMLTDLENATVETLPAFLEQYQKVIAELNEDLKKEKIQRDIFYTFTFHLKDIFDQETFETFKANFSEYTTSMFASATNKDFFINGFNKVKSYSDFQFYFDNLSSDYNKVNQNYLIKANAIKAQTGLIKQVSDIKDAISVAKKQYDLNELQKSIKSHKSGAIEFNVTLNLVYLFFIVTLASMIIFLLWNVFVNIKSNLTLLLGVVAIILLVFLGYIFSSSELSPIALKLQEDPGTVKWIGAGIFTFYCTFFGAIAAILFTLIHSTIKNIK